MQPKHDAHQAVHNAFQHNPTTVNTQARSATSRPDHQTTPTIFHQRPNYIKRPPNGGTTTAAKENDSYFTATPHKTNTHQPTRRPNLTSDWKAVPLLYWA